MEDLEKRIKNKAKNLSECKELVVCILGAIGILASDIFDSDFSDYNEYDQWEYLKRDVQCVDPNCLHKYKAPQFCEVVKKKAGRRKSERKKVVCR